MATYRQQREGDSCTEAKHWVDGKEKAFLLTTSIMAAIIRLIIIFLYLVRPGKEDKYPNEHGLGSLSVLFAAQLPWNTKLIIFLLFTLISSYLHRAILVKKLLTYLLCRTPAMCCRGSETNGCHDRDTGPKHQ